MAWEKDFEGWLKAYVEKHGLTNADNATPKMLWNLGFWEAAHLIKPHLEEARKIGAKEENERCKEVLAGVFSELVESGTDWEKLQQAVFFALNSDESGAESAPNTLKEQ